MTHKIVFLERDTIAPHINIRRPVFDHGWTEYDRTSANEVMERLSEATIAITNIRHRSEGTVWRSALI